MPQIISDLVEPFTDAFTFVSTHSAVDRHIRVESERDGMAQTPCSHLGNFMALADRALDRFIKKLFSDMVNHIQGAFRVVLVIFGNLLEEGAHIFRREALFDTGKIKAHDGGNQLRVYSKESLHVGIGLQWCLALQT